MGAPDFQPFLLPSEPGNLQTSIATCCRTSLHPTTRLSTGQHRIGGDASRSRFGEHRRRR